MEIQRNDSAIPDPWNALQKLYVETGSLYQDMIKNPQNVQKDLEQLEALAQKMEAITSQMPTPPSAPGFHEDFEHFLSDLTQLKNSYVSGIETNPTVQKRLEHEAGVELNNICRDIFQG